MSIPQILRLAAFPAVFAFAVFASPVAHAADDEDDEEETRALPITDGKVVYSTVVTVDGATKDDLFARARLWLPEAFKDSKDAIQVDDKENGMLLGKGRTIVRERGFQPVVKTWGYTVKVQTKDGKYKIDMYDINYTFEMPGNNIGAGPSYMVFDEYFSDESNFKKDGTIKRRAGRNISDWAWKMFDDLSGGLEKAMRAQASKDDF